MLFATISGQDFLNPTASSHSSDMKTPLAKIVVNSDSAQRLNSESHSGCIAIFTTGRHPRVRPRDPHQLQELSEALLDPTKT